MTRLLAELPPPPGPPPPERPVDSPKRDDVRLPIGAFGFTVFSRLRADADSVRAKRLLPMDMFEYENGKVSSSLVVPEEGSSSYQKWYYVYDDKGLKAKDFCYNKEKELLGSIEYQYSYK